MVNNNSNHILKYFLNMGGVVELKVQGYSMLPIINHNQVVKVKRRERYKEGDVVVFEYKNKELIAHRILKIKKSMIFCKGDNSFRLENIGRDKILGAVLLYNDTHRAPSFLSESLKINTIFRQFGYDENKTKLTKEYIEYKEKYLN